MHSPRRKMELSHACDRCEASHARALATTSAREGVDTRFVASFFATVFFLFGALPRSARLMVISDLLCFDPVSDLFTGPKMGVIEMRDNDKIRIVYVAYRTSKPDNGIPFSWGSKCV